MRSLSARVVRLVGATAALVMVLALVPASARAQYELTFDPSSCGYPPDPTLETCSNGLHITPAYGTITSVINVDNGILPGFGNASTAPTNSLFSGLEWSEGGCCGLATTDGLATPFDLNGFAGTEVGAIQFAVIQPNSDVTLTSLMIGASNVKTDGTTQPNGTITSAEVRIYDVVTGTLLYDQTNTFAEGQNAGVPTTFNPNVCGANGDGLVVEWAAGSTNPISIESYGINDVDYNVSSTPCPSTAPPSNVSPEPGVMTLLAFGLVGLAPLARRRRRVA